MIETAIAKQQLPKVPQYLSAQIQISGLKQKDIADALGYTKPNIITMFKQGLTKVPIEKVGALAKVLGVDAVYLLRIVMNDYMPGTYNAVTTIFGQEPITDNEKKIITKIRALSNGTNPALSTEHSERKLEEFVQSLG
ncbi:HTH_XRE domain containing protein [uncultured Caudovirales phage]|uniref:HTH_XRE domain containing protein n=1 Tax=uncultured Caudovirales phage TaxID=2100421 RepID=A0A6J5KS24_9CAUD|nr:HTH_XRE domain containing protein [uncultured Caudovirales phage]CAB4123955.1 HTH_XRE domain containing protein [uncultured Caudovirales phage]CAB5219503.1 HTH_XRE domain containing protein [uncultured Caudovirales phage]